MKNNRWLLIASALQVGVEIAVIIGGSVFVGLQIDSYLNMTPLFLLLMLILGVVGSFLRILKLGSK